MTPQCIVKVDEQELILLIMIIIINIPLETKSKSVKTTATSTIQLQYDCAANVWCIKNCTKHSTKTLLSLVQFLMHQML